MNLFLLTSVPLAALALHLFLRRPHPNTLAPWAWGSVAALGSLLLTSFLGGLRIFDGDLGRVFLGLTLTDVVLVPGVVVALWFWFRRHKDLEELRLWLAIVFTFAGIRDFAATNSTFDLGELFLVPLDRILILIALPLLGLRTRGRGWERSLALVGVGALLLTGSVFPVLSLAGWGWMVWVLVVGGIALGVYLEKKAAPRGSGPSQETATEVAPPAQP